MVFNCYCILFLDGWVVEPYDISSLRLLDGELARRNPVLQRRMSAKDPLFRNLYRLSTSRCVYPRPLQKQGRRVLESSVAGRLPLHQAV